jgi:hypothetical protein
LLGGGIGHLKSILHYGKDPSANKVGIVVNQKKIFQEEEPKQIDKFLSDSQKTSERKTEDSTRFRLNQLLKNFTCDTESINELFSLGLNLGEAKQIVDERCNV